ncbi:MAG: hypothetical protein AB9917_13635 [Negativicutes bacterium]
MSDDLDVSFGAQVSIDGVPLLGVQKAVIVFDADDFGKVILTMSGKVQIDKAQMPVEVKAECPI